MDQSILNFVFKKYVAMGITTVAMGITTVATDIDNSYVATGVHDIIMPSGRGSLSRVGHVATQRWGCANLYPRIDARH
jgi:hypothetical protein